MKVLPLRYRLARMIIQKWPLPRGRSFVYRMFLRDTQGLPDAADFDFDYGRFINAGLGNWPDGYREVYFYGYMEDGETDIWKKLVREGEVVIDGGANFGYFTLLASKIVGITGHVFAFEPVPSTAEALSRNVEASNCRNVTVVQAALMDSACNIELNIFEDDPIGAQASVSTRDKRNVSKTIKVKGISLNDFSREKGITPVLIKLDVEGCELNALRGATTLLDAESAPAITFEWNVDTAKGMGYLPTDILDFLDGYKYNPYLVDNNKLIPFSQSLRTYKPDWFPMVWCLKKGEMQNRAERMGIL